MDWIKLGLGVSLCVTIPLTIKFIINKVKFSIQAKNGDILIAPGNSSNKNNIAVTIKGNDNKVNANLGSSAEVNK